MKSVSFGSVKTNLKLSLPLGAMLATAACFMLPLDFAAAQTVKAVVRAPDPKMESMDPKMFGRSTQIDNKWWSMKPGTRFTYVGTSVEDDGKVVPHSIVITITDLTKVIGGVRTLVSYDLDYKDRELVEAELAFFAQDDEGSVWRFGEYPEEYEDKKRIGAPTWLHGIAGAKAGIAMRAKPQLGTPPYFQGWGPEVGWTDYAQILQMGQQTKVKFGKFDDVMVIKETSKAEEADGYQLKYYAPGVGNVRVGWGGNKDKSQEMMELVKLEQLSPKEMAAVRDKAMALEKSAYKVSPKVYGLTAKMEVIK